MYVRLLLSLLCVLGCAALADASPFAYVANYYGNSVTRIDLSKTTDNTTIIPLPGSAGPYGVAVNAFGSRVYVSSKDGYVISVIDTADNIVSNISLPFKPGALAVDSAGTRLYVADPEHDSLAVLDALTGAYIKPVTVGAFPFMGAPQGVAVSGNTVYVSATPSIDEQDPATYGVVHMFDASLDAMTPLGTINVGQLPMGLTLNAAGDRLYVACSQANKVNAINLSVQTPTVTVIPADGSGVSISKPVGVALSSDGLKAYVTLAGEHTVAVINTQTGTINAQRIAVGNTPMGIAITPDGTRVAVANSESDTVSVINPATDTLVGGPVSVGEGNSSPQSLGKFAGPELIPVYFPYPFNGTVTPGVPITLDGTYTALVPKGINLPLDVQPAPNFIVGSVTDYTNNQVLTPPYTLTNIVGEREITATFTRVARDVVVTKPGTGTGKVVSTSPATPSIDCGTSCTATYPLNNVVVLAAQSDPGSFFQGWAGAMCSGTGTCRISISGGYPSADGNYYVEAHFAKSLISTLQDAYNSAATGTSIDCEATYTTEPTTSFNAGLAKTVTLKPAAANTVLTLPAEHKVFTVQYGQIIIGGTTGGAFIIK